MKIFSRRNSSVAKVVSTIFFSVMMLFVAYTVGMKAGEQKNQARASAKPIENKYPSIKSGVCIEPLGPKGTVTEMRILDSHPSTGISGRWMEVRVEKGHILIKDPNDEKHSIKLGKDIAGQPIFINLDSLK